MPYCSERYRPFAHQTGRGTGYIHNGGRRAARGCAAVNDQINVLPELSSYLFSSGRAWFSGKVGAGRRKSAIKCLYQCAGSGVGGDADGDGSRVGA